MLLLTRTVPAVRLGLLIVLFQLLILPAMPHQAGAGDAEPLFFADVPDLPVMPGLVEDTEAGLVFDRPEGRIVEAVAVGAVTVDAVRAYYDAVLPSLGWQAVDGGHIRGPESLTIATEPQAQGLIVRVSLKPAGG